MRMRRKSLAVSQGRNRMWLYRRSGECRSGEDRLGRDSPSSSRRVWAHIQTLPWVTDKNMSLVAFEMCGGVCWLKVMGCRGLNSVVGRVWLPRLGKAHSRHSAGSARWCCSYAQSALALLRLGNRRRRGATVVLREANSLLDSVGF